jgi:hypothetical protein
MLNAVYCPAMTNVRTTTFSSLPISHPVSFSTSESLSRALPVNIFQALSCSAFDSASGSRPAASPVSVSETVMPVNYVKLYVTRAVLVPNSRP